MNILQLCHAGQPLAADNGDASFSLFQCWRQQPVSVPQYGTLLLHEEKHIINGASKPTEEYRNLTLVLSAAFSCLNTPGQTQPFPPEVFTPASCYKQNKFKPWLSSLVPTKSLKMQSSEICAITRTRKMRQNFIFPEITQQINKIRKRICSASLSSTFPITSCCHPSPGTPFQPWHLGGHERLDFPLAMGT